MKIAKIKFFDSFSPQFQIRDVIVVKTFGELNFKKKLILSFKLSFLHNCDYENLSKFIIFKEEGFFPFDSITNLD